MEMIDDVLASFGVEFIQSMNASLREWHTDGLHIRIQSHTSAPLVGAAAQVWLFPGIPYILLYHHPTNEEANGITNWALAHEIGHVIHHVIFNHQFVARGSIDTSIRNTLSRLNGSFSYTNTSGADARDRWNASTHGTTFVNHLGMTDATEDIATMFEVLVSNTTYGITQDIVTRLSNPVNDPLLQKMIYIRDLTYKYIGEPATLFNPIYEALEMLAIPDDAI
jgi:hypothetical protein